MTKLATTHFHSQQIGKSHSGQAINILTADEFARPSVLVMSGFHGDEIEGLILNTMLFNHVVHTRPEFQSKVAFLPTANPDGLSLFQRWTTNHVDLNRNWPSKDWTAEFTNPRYPPGPCAESESETKALRAYLEKSKIKIILDLHSYKEPFVLPSIARPNEKLLNFARDLAETLEVPIDEDPHALGYEITGGFHTWCIEHGIHDITLEIEKGLGQFAIRERYLEPVFKFLGQITV